jgi:hypothetical protein
MLIAHPMLLPPVGPLAAPKQRRDHAGDPPVLVGLLLLYLTGVGRACHWMSPRGR